MQVQLLQMVLRNPLSKLCDWFKSGGNVTDFVFPPEITLNSFVFKLRSASAALKMTAKERSGEPAPFQAERIIEGAKFIVSDNVDFVSYDFVNTAFGSSDMPWADPLGSDDMRVMLNRSTLLSLYSVDEGSGRPFDRSQLKQLGMARLITDHITFAWITDVYVLGEYRKLGLGKWLIQCCQEVLDRMPALRRAMLVTSNPPEKIKFYEKYFGMNVLVQDPNKLVVMSTKRAKSIV